MDIQRFGAFRPTKIPCNDEQVIKADPESKIPISKEGFQLDCDINKSALSMNWTFVLQYIRDETCRYKVFVANRVSEITEETNPDQRNYEVRKNNPVDISGRDFMFRADLFKKNEDGESWAERPKLLWNDKEC